MRMTVDEISEEALTLPLEHRALLANLLIKSLESEENFDLQELWAAEALRRRDEIRTGKVHTIPAEEALARVRAAVAR